MKYLIPIIITVVAFLEASLRLGANEGANDFIEPVLAAADNGNATAQALVGTMYYYGYGLSQDYKKALFWYKLAAEFGEVSAQATLGRMYYLGHAVRHHEVGWRPGEDQQVPRQVVESPVVPPKKSGDYWKEGTRGMEGNGVVSPPGVES